MYDGDDQEDDDDSHELSPERKQTSNKNSAIISNTVTPVSISESVPHAPPEVIAEIIQQ